MDLDLKVVSKEINEILWRNHKTLSTAESCTSGRVASVFNTDYAISVTGFAGPGGVENGKNGVLVGTIWIAVGNSQRIETVMLEEDNGRDKNLASATSTAMHMLLDFLKADLGTEEEA